MSRSATTSFQIGKVVAIIYAMGVLALGATIAMALCSNRPIDHFTRDPLAVTDTPFYVGTLSNLTVAAWFAAAGALWAVSATLWAGEVSRRRALALAMIAALVTILGTDDLFMLHEESLQRHAGIPENVTIGLYGAFACMIAMVFGNVLRSTPWPLLMTAGVFFAASLGVDQWTTGFGWRIAIEDGLKFLGVIGILAYAITTAMTVLVGSTVSPACSPDLIQRE